MKSSNTMADHAELKRAAQAASQGRWNQDGFDVQNDDIEDYRVCRCNLLADAKFIAAANPTTVLALIAESETLTKLFADAPDLPDTDVEWLERTRALEVERDQHRAEVAGLPTGYEAYERVNAELKAENEALRKDDLRAGLMVLAAYIGPICTEAVFAAMGKGEQS